MRLAIVMLMGLVLAASLGLQEQAPRSRVGLVETGPRFEAVDVFVDSGATPLGAWQVEIKALPHGGSVKLVGIEGGAGVYKDPPYYDPAALHEDQFQDRIILAAFTTAADPPSGRTRVARLHVEVTGGAAEYSVKLMTAGAADGSKIDAKATTSPTEAGDRR